MRKPNTGKAVAKAHLPTKTCPTCGRSFVWRKKWARDWDNVRYCSDACRGGKHPAATGNTAQKP